MKRSDHTPVYVLTGRALAEAGMPWMPIGFIVGQLQIPPQSMPSAANEETKP